MIVRALPYTTDMLFLWLIYPIAEACIQGLLFRRGNYKPVYLMLFVIRGIAAIVHGALMDVRPEPWYEWPMLLAWQCGTFWLLFDPLLNWWRGLPFDYEGKQSGWLAWVPYWLQVIISITLIWIGFNYWK